MQLFRPFSPRTLALLSIAIGILLLVSPANGQTNPPCNASMLSSFTPCLNFVTNSTGNGTAPTSDCCNAISSLASGGRDCLCLIVTGGVPFQVPINRTLAISLPRACNLPGVPLQCQAAGAPIPAPGPIALGPRLSPDASPPSSVSEPIAPAITPEAESPTLLTPPSVGSEAPSATAGSRPVLTPSSAALSHNLPSSLPLLGLAFVAFKFYRV